MGCTTPIGATTGLLSALFAACILLITPPFHMPLVQLPGLRPDLPNALRP